MQAMSCSAHQVPSAIYNLHDKQRCTQQPDLAPLHPTHKASHGMLTCEEALAP